MKEIDLQRSREDDSQRRLKVTGGRFAFLPFPTTAVLWIVGSVSSCNLLQLMDPVDAEYGNSFGFLEEHALAKPKKSSSKSSRPPRSSSSTSSSSSYSAGRVTAPPSVPNAALSYSEVQSRDKCPVLMQIVDSPVLRDKSKTRNRGEAPLQWIAKEFQLVSKTETSATWQAHLVHKYENCNADAYLSTRGRQTLEPDESHIFLAMERGLLRLTLDLEHLSDPAELTRASVSGGIPTWSWSFVTPEKGK